MLLLLAAIGSFTDLTQLRDWGGKRTLRGAKTWHSAPQPNLRLHGDKKTNSNGLQCWEPEPDGHKKSDTTQPIAPITATRAYAGNPFVSLSQAQMASEAGYSQRPAAAKSMPS